MLLFRWMMYHRKILPSYDRVSLSWKTWLLPCMVVWRQMCRFPPPLCILVILFYCIEKVTISVETWTNSRIQQKGPDSCIYLNCNFSWILMDARSPIHTLRETPSGTAYMVSSFASSLHQISKEKNSTSLEYLATSLNYIINHLILPISINMYVQCLLYQVLWLNSHQSKFQPAPGGKYWLDKRPRKGWIHPQLKP